MTGDRLSDLDALFLRGETPTLHQQNLACIVLSAPPEGIDPYAQFQRRIRERYRLVDAMRRRLAGAAPLAWVDADDIYVEEHLHHVVVDGGFRDTLARVASQIASRPLDRRRPLWECWLVEGLDEGRVAVIAKIHHSAVDGVSGIGALAAFFDLQPDVDPAPGEIPDAPRPADDDRKDLLARSVEAVSEAVRRPLAAARGARHVLSASMDLVRSSGDGAAIPFGGPSLSINGSLTPRRSVAFTHVPLDDVKSIRHGLELSVNDVITGLITGVLRTHLSERDELPDRPLVAAVPVSERLGEHGMAGNRFSFMFYALPVHLHDPVQRLLAVKRSATAAKDVYARSGEGLLGSIAAMVPPLGVGSTMRALSAARLIDLLPPLANVTLSSIRGVDVPLYVVGATLEDMFPMGPLFEGCGLGVTAASYRDRIDIGFMACPDLVDDVEGIADLVPSEFAALATATSGP